MSANKRNIPPWPVVVIAFLSPEESCVSSCPAVDKRGGMETAEKRSDVSWGRK